MKEVLNSLAKENSIYLKEHAGNPVNWISWSDYLQLKSNSDEKKPLFISIGYSSCHWCHVMAEESFSDDEIASFLNKHFISIKVDKEEYPDVDKKYQLFINLIGKQGGWPLSIFADFDGRPFFAGTYFPKFEKYGMPSFMDILKSIFEVYSNDYKKIYSTCEEYENAMKKLYSFEKRLWDGHIFLEEFKPLFDMEKGGLKSKQKFPNIPVLNYLLEFCEEDEYILKFLEKTADSLCISGIFDHVEGGFFRYAVDSDWNIPHFEKMLYDNGLNLSFLSRMYGLTDKPLYYNVSKRTADFILEKFLTDYGFGSSYDADSQNYDGVKQEGFYYLFDEKIIEKLTRNEAELLSRLSYFNENHLRLIKVPDENEYRNMLQIFEKLSNRRKEIKRLPRFDEKVIFSWNMIAISGLMDFYEVSSDEYYFNRALDIYFLLYENMTLDGKIYRINYKKSIFDHSTLEDYSYFIDATMKIFRITKDKNFLHIIKIFLKNMSGLFEKGKIFYYNKDKNYIDFMDEATPSAIAILANNLVDLACYINLDGFDIGKLADFLGCFHVKYPLGTPTIGVFLKKYRLNKEVL